jgi:S-adenosylmethionine-diacylgycerolhomoserine-N-methlytransferase
MTSPAASQKLAMDRMYRYQRHVYDASRHYYLFGRDRLLQYLSPPTNGTVLEIGCGTGRNLVKLARARPDTRLYGIDISAEMLKSATHSLARHGLAGRISLAETDASTFSPPQVFGLNTFDRIFFSYTLSMIPDWRGALSRAVACLSPAGELHVVDFGLCEHLPPVSRRLLFRWLEHFSVRPRAGLPAEIRRIAASVGGASRFDSLYRGYAWSFVLHKEPPRRPVS